MSGVVASQSPAASAHATRGLDDLFAAIRDANPFAANRVTEPSPYDVDVPAINAAQFDRLVQLAGQSLRTQSGVGVALLGGAGVGKSHLLSRLYRWANETGESGGPRACYVYLHNILADPDRLPRYLLKYVISRLSEGARGPLHQTPLYRFVDRGIRIALEEARIEVDSPEETIKHAWEAYRAYFHTGAAVSPAYEVLFQFWRYARPEKADEPGRRSLAVAAVGWLAGDEIDPSFAARLGLKVNDQEPVMLRDDQDVQHVLTSLTRLAQVSRQPFILCVDQVENLDPDKLKPLSRFLHALLDRATNLLIITSGVKQSLLAYQDDGIIPEAAWDRIAQYQVELSRVPRHDARKILEARIERFHEPYLEIGKVKDRLQVDTLFPLGRAWLDDRIGDALEVRPRDILTWARDAWEDEHAKIVRLGGEAWLRGWPWPAPPVALGRALTPLELEALIDSAVDRKTEEQVSQLRLLSGSLPPDAGNLAGLVETLLAQCAGDGLPYTFRGVERMKKRAGRLPPYDLLVREHREPDGREVTTGVLFVTNVGLSATTALRRLLEDDAAPDHRLLVTDHERRPLKVGAQGVEYYRDLEKLGPEKFEHLKITFDQYARLDALRDVVGMARSGDLEIEAPRGKVRPVSDGEVIASHHRKDRFRHHPLLRPLLTEEPGMPPPLPPPLLLDEQDVRQYVMAQLAWMMGAMAQSVVKGYLEIKKEMKATYDTAWPQAKPIVERMHAEGLIYATPHDDDLFLLLRK